MNETAYRRNRGIGIFMKHIKALLTGFTLIFLSAYSLAATISSDMMFSANTASKFADPRVIISVIKEVELPSAYGKNGKYALCKMSFNLTKSSANLYTPKNVNIDFCNTNDESGLLMKRCLKAYPKWGFSPKVKGDTVSETERFIGTCALRGKEDRSIIIKE
ncbi:MAG TPA: hypothetical protein VL987_03585 [Cellvibrio sp.]|nr:hypothetical protein [Cellvibrio sp.]